MRTSSSHTVSHCPGQSSSFLPTSPRSSRLPLRICESQSSSSSVWRRTASALGASATGSTSSEDMKLCKMCKKYYDPAANTDRSCRYHPKVSRQDDDYSKEGLIAETDWCPTSSCSPMYIWRLIREIRRGKEIGVQTLTALRMKGCGGAAAIQMSIQLDVNTIDIRAMMNEV